ncbi:DUF305 domain-containing protein [Micromonospora ureilytica]|uniref:Uncharacterized protein (DUF305 family) n=1 Tax=Micromonospora ureilytica TaxID=709868 RepID=A0ABS0JFL1_9ACTN|nr:DUF305 domain-containing protein [Micromonospora ureilytica]MBG6065761.1 uncharacterized protein (DUF305 family) [Micromonospora ureilytica]
MTVRRGRLLIVVITMVVLTVFVVVAVRATGDSPRSAAATTSPSPASASPSPTPTGPEPPPVIVPGRPGEAAVTRPAHEVRDDSPPRFNALDTVYVQMMIPHHEQALEMTALADERASDPRIRAYADRIRAGQGPEIAVLRTWLSTRGLPPSAPGHDHSGMRGMQSPEAMRQLTDARGTEFDRLFVRMMSEHHQGAVTMATDLLSVGLDPTLNELATSLATEQAVEIARLRELTPP